MVSESAVKPLNDPPVGWTSAKLGDVVETSKRSIDPRNFPLELFEYYSIPAYQSSGLPIQELGSAIGSQKLLVEPGTVLFGKLNPRVPKVWRVSGSTSNRRIASTEFIPLAPIDGRIDGEFLYFLSQSHLLMGKAKGLVSGSTPSRQRVDPRSFLALQIPLPPVEEQRAIAGALESVQQARVAAETTIAATGALRLSLTRHLFTYGLTSMASTEGVPLKETEIGPIPEHWSLASVGDVSQVKGGKRLPKGHAFSATRTSYPYVRVVDLKDGSVDLADLRYLTEGDHKTLWRYTISKDDIYISIAGTIGVVGQIPQVLDGAHLTENAAKLIVGASSQLDQRFAVAFLASEMGQRQIESFTSRTSQPKLALARIAQIVLPVPPRHEQKAIAEILDALSDRIRAQARHREALGLLFDSMLYELMTGARRVSLAGVA